MHKIELALIMWIMHASKPLKVPVPAGFEATRLASILNWSLITLNYHALILLNRLQRAPDRREV